MNIKEFAALKAGDRIENPMAGTAGIVTEIDGPGVTVRWEGIGSAPATMARYYSVVTTAWMHWVKAES